MLLWPNFSLPFFTVEMIAFSTLPLENGEGYKGLRTFFNDGAKNIEMTWNIGLSLDDRESFLKVSGQILKTGVKIVSSHAPLRLSSGAEADLASTDEWDRKIAIRETQKSLFALNSITSGEGGDVVIHCGRKIEGAARARRIALSVDSLKEIMDYAEDENFKIKFCLENTLPGDLGSRLEDLLEIKEKINSAKVKFCLDTGHYNIGPEHPDLLREMARDIAHLHVHDNDGKKDLHLAPGEGIIGWDELLTILGKRERLAVFETFDASPGTIRKCLDFAAKHSFV